MKKLIIISVVILTTNLLAQEIKPDRNKRFQVGVQVNPSVINDLLYTGYFGGNVRFKFFQTEKIDLDLGCNFNHFKSDVIEFTDILIFNPNVVLNVKIENSGLKPYLSVGYAFYKSTFTPNIEFDLDPLIGQSKVLNYSGFSISPGVRYHINKTFYIDLNYNYLRFKDDYQSISTKSFNLIGFGVGFKI